MRRRNKKLISRMLLKTAEKANLIQSPSGGEQPSAQQDSLSTDLEANIKVLKSLYADCSDVVFRSFAVGGVTKAGLVYIDGLSNIEEIDQNVIAPLMRYSESKSPDLERLADQIITVTDAPQVQTFSAATQDISSGHPVLLIDGQASAYAIKLTKMEKRAVEEPSAESVVRGPRDGFTEAISVNISLLRRRIKSHRLKMKAMQAGRYTNTRVVVAYVEGIVNPALVEEVTRRLQNINIDGILESGYLEELIEDHSLSPFPQVLNTERPDIAAASLLEGRVVILTDSTPFALVAPATFFSLLQSAEDYYERFLIGTMIRWLRYLFILVALLFPSLYVAILTFHQEMVPTALLYSFAKSREQVPFPALVEALIMEITFEALREAGVRLPKQVGSAVSIVGALVIGQAAVSAGIVSAPMVMVVAITGIASFSIPRFNAAIAIRMLRFPIMILAGGLGLLGIMLGFLAILVHMCSIRSFGMPYMSPVGPIKRRDLKDVLWRAPWWALKTRPSIPDVDNRLRELPGTSGNEAKGMKQES